MSIAINLVTSPKFGILTLIAVALVAMALIIPGRANADHGPISITNPNGHNLTASASSCAVIGGSWDAGTSPPTCTLNHDVVGIMGITQTLTLDGAGHTFTGTVPNASYQTIDVQADNVTVKNTIIVAAAGARGLAGNGWKDVKILDNVITKPKIR